MKRKQTLVGLLCIVLFSSCSQKSEQFQPSVLLFLEPTEEHLWSGEHFSDFVNYKNDWLKMGLKGTVKSVAYSTRHPVHWTFLPNGMLNSMDFIHGDNPYEIDSWRYVRNKEGQLLQTVYDSQLIIGNKKPREFRGNPIDEITYKEDGKPDIRSYFQFKSVSGQKQYQYNEDGICIAMPVFKGKEAGCDLRCDNQGRVTQISLSKVRIPTHGLTRGDRIIYPSYDEKGRIACLTGTSFPKNMEAYNIDSIRYTSSYEYNEQNDVAIWHYTDTVYPQQTVNTFDMSFNYIYDEQGNWIEKEMIAFPGVLKTLMNRLYYGDYPVKTVSENADGTPLCAIVLKRDIDYFTSDELKEGPASSAASTSEKNSPKEEQVSTPNASALGDDVPFSSPKIDAWKVEKVRCNGPKNGGYEFVISGKFVKDCTGYSMSESTVTIAVKEKNRKAVTSAGAYFFPRGKKGEPFTVTVVGAYDGMCNINDFEFLLILQD